MRRKISASTPVARRKNSIGFAPKRPRKASKKRRTSGTRALADKSTLLNRTSFISRPPVNISEVPFQVHPGVQTGHLVSVAVEHQGFPAVKLADASLRGLRPAGVIDVRIHVRVEAVLVRSGKVPCGRRFGVR